MKVVLFGASGFIGGVLSKALEAKGHSVIAADVRKTPAWQSLLDDADAVVNLGGAPIFGKRWDDRVKAEIHSSRVDSTKKIVDALGSAQKKSGRCAVLVNASAIGFYGPSFDETFNEDSPCGSDFLASVCRDWEEAAFKAEKVHGIRTVVVRTGVVLGRGGGALQQMLYPLKTKLFSPFKLGMGGPIGLGKQWTSWIHINDVVGIYIHAIENAQVRGPLNATAPEPLRNKDFTKALAKALKRPAFFPLPGLLLYALYGEVAEILINGQKVLPKATLNSGYRFLFPKLDSALDSILS